MTLSILHIDSQAGTQFTELHQPGPTLLIEEDGLLHHFYIARLVINAQGGLDYSLVMKLLIYVAEIY